MYHGITGGKYVTEGLDGCVFRPAIRCLSEGSVAPNTVSKITRKSVADIEEKINVEIRRIDPNEEYFVTLVKRCSVGEVKKTDGMGKCDLVGEYRYKPGNKRKTIPYEEVLPMFDNLVFTDGGKRNFDDMWEKATQPVLARVFLQVLRGVSLLKRNGIIHSDIHPGNIVVKGMKAKIIDFGSAYRMDDLLAMKPGDYFDKFVKNAFRNATGYIYNPEFAYAHVAGDMVAIREAIEIIRRRFSVYKFKNPLYVLAQIHNGILVETPDNMAAYSENFVKNGGNMRKILEQMDGYIVASMFRAICNRRQIETGVLYDVLVKMTLPDINSRMTVEGAIEELDKKSNTKKMKGGRIISRRKTARRRRGGDYVDEGGYGCVFRPALPCKGQTRKRNAISKILTEENVEDEMRLLKVIKKLDPNQKYFISYVTSCEPARAKKSDELSECGHIREELSEMGEDVEKGDLVTEVPDTMSMIVFPDGGVNLYTVAKNPGKYLKGVSLGKFMESLAPLFKGLVLLDEKGISHFDIKMENILFDGRKCRYIDFGFVDKTKNYYKLSSKYFVYPPETRHSGKDVIKKYNEIFKKYHIELKYSVKDIIGDSEDRSEYKEMVGRKVDIWSLGLALLESLPLIFQYYRRDLDQNVFILIKNMMWPNVFQRLSPVRAYEMYKKVMEMF
jgi:serine/threonine protein kinase